MIEGNSIRKMNVVAECWIVTGNC